MGESLTMRGRFEAALARVDQILERAGIGAEGHAAGVDVGAGDVELVGGDAFGLVEPLDDGEVVADGVAEDVDDDLAAGDSALSGGQLSLDEFFDADVLQADGVEHAGRGLDNARRLRGRPWARARCPW